MSSIFNYGPTGRDFNVDSEGRLLVNASAAVSGYIFGYGDTGYPMVVDGLGRIMVNVSGLSASQVDNDSTYPGDTVADALENLQILDWQESVLDRGLTAPPSGINENDRYIAASGASGVWSGHDDDIIEYINGSWHFETPTEGAACWVEDENVVIVNNGTQWVIFGSVGTHNNLGGLQGGASGDYYHLGSTNYTDLTDGGDSTLHYHQSDRDYADAAASGASGVLRDDITELQYASGVLRSDVDSNDADISLLQYASGNLDSRVNTNASNISSNDSDITELQYASGVLRGDVDDNDTDIAALQAVSGNSNKYSEVINYWTPNGGLYYKDVVHSLGDVNVIDSYFNDNTNESVMVDHSDVIDADTLRVFVTASGTPIKVIIL